MKIVILDSYAFEEGDLDWSPLQSLASSVQTYARTAYSQAAQRIGTAEIVIVNKCRIDDAVLDACPQIRFVGVTATGTDSLDVQACRRRGVTVCNVPAYSTASVAQLTIALLLNLCQSPAAHENALRDGYWQLNVPPRYGIMPQRELDGMTMGLVGYGNIARRVADIARALGMRVIASSRTRCTGQENGVQFVSLAQLLAGSDVVSLHCPCTPQTEKLINDETLAQMKPGALLINTARGRLTDEQAVARALQSGRLAGYGADVLETEPPQGASPLFGAPHTVLTPHIAWATQQSLARLAHCVCENVRLFLAGTPQNVVQP